MSATNTSSESSLYNNHQQDQPLPSDCAVTSFCNPTNVSHRFIALFFLCFLGFGSCFCYDNPAALQDHLQHDLNMTATQYVLLYSIYSWPNVLMCFIGGFLVDRFFGVRMGAVIYQVIILLGQIIFASGVICDVFALTIFGRLIFGIGSESLAVAQNKYTVVWFKGKELNMAFGLQMSIARVGSAVSLNVIEPIYQHYNTIYRGYVALGVTLFSASLACVLSIICTVAIGLLDKRAERILQRYESPQRDVVKLSDIKTFKINFWMTSIICVTYYAAVFPFIAMTKSLFMEKFDFTVDGANTLTSIIYYISAAASPLCGLAIDKFGRNITWILVSVSITILSHVLLVFTNLTPYISICLVGMAYSMVTSSLWPVVAIVVPQYQLGTAYGVFQSVQNLGLAFVSILTGIVMDHSGYISVEIIFIFCLSFALISTLVLWIYDERTQGNLNVSSSQRQAILDALYIST